MRMYVATTGSYHVHLAACVLSVFLSFAKYRVIAKYRLPLTSTYSSYVWLQSCKPLLCTILFIWCNALLCLYYILYDFLCYNGLCCTLIHCRVFLIYIMAECSMYIHEQLRLFMCYIIHWKLRIFSFHSCQLIVHCNWQ